MKRESTQSIAVSPEEKNAVEVLALAERMKPATFARAIFYKGLSQYLKDRKPHAPKRDEEVYEEIVKLIDSEDELRKIKAVVEYRVGLMGPGKDVGKKAGRK